MMRIAAAAVLAFSLAGCATFQKVVDGVPNPVTPQSVVTVKLAFEGALVGAVAYRDLCDRKVIKRETCAPVVAKLQSIAATVRTSIRQAEAFSVAYPTVDASSLVAAANQALQGFLAAKAAAGVQ